MKIKILIALNYNIGLGCEEDVKGLWSQIVISLPGNGYKNRKLVRSKITYNTRIRIYCMLCRVQSRMTFIEIKSSIYKNFIILEGFPIQGNILFICILCQDLKFVQMA